MHIFKKKYAGMQWNIMPVLEICTVQRSRPWGPCLFQKCILKVNSHITISPPSQPSICFAFLSLFTQVALWKSEREHTDWLVSFISLTRTI